MALEGRKELELAKTMGYVQGVCESVNSVGDEKVIGNKLLSDMKVTKEMAKKYADPETYKTMEKGIFAPNVEQKLEHKRSHSL